MNEKVDSKYDMGFETSTVEFWQIMYGEDHLLEEEQPHWFEKFDKRTKRSFDDE